MPPLWKWHQVLNGSKKNGAGGDNWSYKTCKVPFKSSPPTNQHPTFHRPNALRVAQPTVSKHLRLLNSHTTLFILRQFKQRHAKWLSMATVIPRPHLFISLTTCNDHDRTTVCCRWCLRTNRTESNVSTSGGTPADIMSFSMSCRQRQNSRLPNSHFTFVSSNSFIYLIYRMNWRALWKNRASQCISFFRPSLSGVLFPMFCLKYY